MSPAERKAYFAAVVGAAKAESVERCVAALLLLEPDLRKLLPVSGSAERMRAGSVYYVLNTGALTVKIGWAVSAEDRLLALQTANSSLLELLATEPGTHATERARQLQFVKHHLRGEWFAFGAELREHVSLLQRSVVK